MPMPACRAWRCTVSTSQASVASRGWVMTRAPVTRLAIHLDISSEMSGAAEAEHGAERQQRPEIEAAALIEDLVDAEQPRHDGQHEQHGDIGRDQQEYAFHSFDSFRNGTTRLYLSGARGPQFKWLYCGRMTASADSRRICR